MFLLTEDDVLLYPKEYVEEIFKYEFQDIADGDKVFKNIQPRDNNDEFARFVLSLFPSYKINWNFVRMSPLNQQEPNYIHKDDMMGDMTCILYLSEEHPEQDGTTIYDEDNNHLFTMYSKFNRMVAFNSDSPHSRNIFENFGGGKQSRLVQVIFLKKK